jgi:hypothetical protein
VRVRSARELVQRDEADAEHDGSTSPGPVIGSIDGGSGSASGYRLSLLGAPRDLRCACAALPCAALSWRSRAALRRATSAAR